jgi:hypothetical protein
MSEDYNGKAIEVGDTVKVLASRYKHNSVGTVISIVGSVSDVVFDLTSSLVGTRTVKNCNLIRWEPEDRI